MKLTLQKRLAADVSGCSEKKIVFDPVSLEDVKEAITKQDVRALIREGVIKVLPARGVSRVRANKIRKQKRKGMKRGAGSRKGSSGARNPEKRAWINQVRSQRKFLRRILEKEIITHDVYRDLYGKVAGGFFRSVKHIQIFMTERNLVVKNAASAAKPAVDKKAKK
jgi:large subunit ribosomal protein L19e